MKRVFILLTILLSLAGRRAMAQDAAPAAPTPAAAATAAAIAAQQAADERLKRMAADFQALQSDNESLKAKISSLEQAIDTLRRQQAAANNSGLQDDLKSLAEKIAEVDRKRLADRESISEEIRKTLGELKKALAGSASSNHTPPPRPQPETPSPTVQNGFSYTIQDGNTLIGIVKAYNVDFKSQGLKPITMKQVMEANPKVDWKRLLVGQKIVIPKPDGPQSPNIAP